jgi:recombination protein RecA
MALMARFMPPELRKITPLLAKTGVTLIAINQVRVDPGVMWGNPETSPGGKAWKHACSLMVNFSSSIKTDMKIFNQRKEQIGHVIKARIDKNKCAPPFRTCEVAIEYLKGIHDSAAEISELAIKYGIVERPNNRTYTYGDHKWTSKDQFINGFASVADVETVLTQVKEAKEKGVVVDTTTEGEEGEE